MVDIGIKEISQTLFSRLKFYKKKEWDIKYLFIMKDGKKTFIDEQKVIEILEGES